MITYDDVLKRSRIGTDITAHVVRLYDFTVQIPDREKVVVELGVRNGNSTVALLAAVNDSGGHLYSVDIKDCPGVQDLYGEEPNWTFIRGNDMEVVKSWNKPIDHLFIDTTHTFYHTLMELRDWGKWVKPGGIISLHDITNVEIMKAINRYRSENPDKYNFTTFDGSYGLGLLRRVKYD